MQDVKEALTLKESLKEFETKDDEGLTIRVKPEKKTMVGKERKREHLSLKLRQYLCG